MNDSIIPIISRAYRFISETAEDINKQQRDSMAKLKDVVPTIRVAYDIIDTWEKGDEGRTGSISYSKDWTWSTAGFDIFLTLSENDKLKDVSPYLRPFKSKEYVSFKNYKHDTENGKLRITYVINNTKREIDVTVDVGQSKSCKRIQTGVKEVPVYETVCDDDVNVDNISEDDIKRLTFSDDEIPF